MVETQNRAQLRNLSGQANAFASSGSAVSNPSATEATPYIWHYQTVHPSIMEAAEMISAEEAEPDDAPDDHETPEIRDRAAEDPTRHTRLAL